MTPATSYTPLPVRRRDLLEVFDTGLKLYRRYFWVLLAWSFISNLANSICGCTFIFSAPLIVGACSCSIAAAVRGQNITFGQCWRFLKPRFWATVGQFLLVVILSWIGFFGLWVILLMAVVWGGMAMAALHLPSSVMMILSVILVLVGIVLCTIVMSVIFGWMCITPIIVCLEDDKRGGAAQTRAWDLMRREWLRATGLYSLLGLSSVAVLGIVGGFLLLLMGLKNVEQMMEGTGNMNETAFFFGFSALSNLVGTFTYPLIMLVSGVFYLDLRVRKEALDIEWSAHVSAPAAAAVEAPPASGGALQQASNSAAALDPSHLGSAPGSSPPPNPVVDKTWEMENFGPPPATSGAPAASLPEFSTASPGRNAVAGSSPPTDPSVPPPAPSAETARIGVAGTYTPPSVDPTSFAPPPPAPESSSFSPPLHTGGFASPPPPAPATGFGTPPSYSPPPVETSSFAPPIHDPSSFAGTSSFNPPTEPTGFAPAPVTSSFGSSVSGDLGDPSSFGAPSGFAPPAAEVEPTGFTPSSDSGPVVPPEPPVVEWKPSVDSVDTPRTD